MVLTGVPDGGGAGGPSWYLMEEKEELVVPVGVPEGGGGAGIRGWSTWRKRSW